MKIISTIIILFSLSIYSQILEEKTIYKFFDTDSGEVNSMIFTKDSLLTIIGKQKRFMDTTTDAVLIKCDLSGRISRKSTIVSSTSSEFFNAISLTNTDTLVLIGREYDPSTVKYRFKIFAVNAITGVLFWSKFISDIDASKVSYGACCKTINNKYVFVLDSLTASKTDSSKLIVLQTDSAMNIEWIKRPFKQANVYSGHIIQRRDSSLFLCGQFQKKGMTCVLSKTGDSLWLKTVSSSCSSSCINQCFELNDNSILALSTGIGRTSVIGLSSNGNTNWFSSTNKNIGGLTSGFRINDNDICAIGLNGYTPYISKIRSDGISIFTNMLNISGSQYPKNPLEVKSFSLTNCIIGLNAFIFKIQTTEGTARHNLYYLCIYKENYPPVFISTSSDMCNTAQTDKNYTDTVSAYDPIVGDNIYYYLLKRPNGMTINALSGMISWIPQIDNIGTDTVKILASDNYGLSDTLSYLITVSTGTGKENSELHFSNRLSIVKIYQNPFSSLLSFDIFLPHNNKAHSRLDMILYGVNGRLVYQKQYNHTKSGIQHISVSNSEIGQIGSGIYLLELRTDKSIVRKNICHY